MIDFSSGYSTNISVREKIQYKNYKVTTSIQIEHMHIKERQVTALDDKINTG